ncbi:MAG: BMP family ABC transporter substrate-binding protein [Acidobacteriota bacterium]|nr:BMP family ABC transporter substrate-binding protein [Acidobacteriota bacterium]
MAVLAAGVASVSTAASSHGARAHAAGGLKFSSVAIATPAKTDDYGWNAQGVAGLKAAAKKYGVKVKVVQNLGYNNTAALLRQIANGSPKPGLVVAHASGYDTAAQQVSKQTGVPMITYDIPSMLSKGTLSNITTSAQQGGYLAGVLAARTTKTKKVGVIISASDTNWYEMTGGFAAGVRSVNPKIKISFGQIGPASYDDSAGGKRVATSVIAAGADVIFAMGDGASFGYLQGISTAKAGHKVWYIGDIGNMTPIDNKHVLLSSVLWNFTTAYETFFAQLKKGTFGTMGYNLTLANGGISLLHSKYIPASVWSAITKATRGIESGKIKVPDTTTAAKTQALLKKA